jgi:ABC-type transport system involved in multi-copper enzyme maturation permease subunit
MLVYLGILKFGFVGKSVSFNEAQWGPAFWALIMAAIWFWVATGFWNLRAYAVQFGIFISLSTLIWGFFALLFGSTYEARTIPWLLAGFIYLDLSWPGVQKAFIENEMSELTAEQRATMEQLAAANAAAQAKSAPGMTQPPASTPPSAS